jgi:hypothetical protein
MSSGVEHAFDLQFCFRRGSKDGVTSGPFPGRESFHDPSVRAVWIAAIAGLLLTLFHPAPLKLGKQLHELIWPQVRRS